MGGKTDLLLVEDDETLSGVLALHLEAAGYAVRAVEDGALALASCEAAKPDVVLLDVMLPGRSGIEVCQELRARYGARMGVVILTALGSEPDVVVGLDAGADDYVVKPIRPRELIARLRSLTRRLTLAPGGASASRALVFGPLRIDEDKRELDVRGAPIHLTATEWDLLSCLVQEPRRVFSRAALLERVFDTTHRGYARNVDCHVARLRRKLEAAKVVGAIETVHGAGYRFVPPA